MSRLRKVKNQREAMALEKLDNENRQITKKFQPNVALGVAASRNIEDINTAIPIVTIFIFTFIFGTMSSIMLSTRNFRNELNKNITIVITSISWFVFVNFFFLLLQQTRLLNIFLFLIVAGLAMKVWDDNRDPDGDKLLSDIMLSIAVLAFIPFIILLGYYFKDNSVEILEIRTNEQLRKYRVEKEEEIKRRIEVAVNDSRNRMLESGNPLGAACNQIFDAIKNNAVNQISSGRRRDDGGGVRAGAGGTRAGAGAGAGAGQ